MNFTLESWKHEEVEVDDTGGATLTGAPDGTVTLRRPPAPDLTADVRDQPGEDPEIACWLGADWVVAVGLDGHRVVSFDLAGWVVHTFDGPERLYLEGYDPGGMNRAVFHPVPGGLLLETEVSLARLDRAGVRWQYVHGDLSVRVSGLGLDRVELEGDGVRAVLALADGKVLDVR